MLQILFYVSGLYKQTPGAAQHTVNIRVMHNNAEKSPIAEFSLQVDQDAAKLWAAKVGTFTDPIDLF